jgi:branched-chain amino acid transport system ATP-binding protein
MDPGAPVLRTEDLSKRFGTLVAVDGVSWRLEEGQSTAIIGPNGAGKTTLFNLVAGVYPPTTGRVLLGDEDVTGVALDGMARRGVVKTYQITSVFRESTVFENVRIAAQSTVTTFDVRRHWSDLEAVCERAEEAVADLGLEEYRDVPAAELSYGYQRILEIAMVLATDPAVVLFDEPTAGLAPDAIDRFVDLLGEVTADRSLTTVVIEHDIEVAVALADRLTAMHDGAILVDGDPDEVLSNEKLQDVYLED